jgi:UDP-glucose:glycoprotein glucosyltransferase
MLGLAIKKMGFAGVLQRLAGAIVFATCLRSPYVSASPSINVALKTSFDSPPYLLELL